MPYGDLKYLYTQLGARRGYDGNTTRLTSFLNQAIHTIWGYRPDWVWARRQVQFNAVVPETGAAATFANGSPTVTGLVAPTDPITRTGALFSTPEGTVYRLAFTSAAGSTVTLPTNYPGADTVDNGAWTLYYDTYTLPAEMSQIESIVATGNGWEYPLKQKSLLPQHMQTLSRRGYESYPTYYALDESGPSLPAPTVGPTLATSGVGLTGVYQYWFAYYNSVTGEVGPLSPSTSITLANQGVSLTNILTHSDYWRVLFRSRAGGTTPLFRGRFQNSTVTTLSDTTADDSLGFETSGQWYGAYRGSFVNRIRLWPPPDDDYLVNVTYFAGHQPLDRDHDVPSLPRRFIPLVLDMAESYFLREQEAHGAANSREQAVMAKLERISSEQDADPATEIAVGRGRNQTLDNFTRGGVWPRLFNQ